MSRIKQGFKALGHAIKDHKTKCSVDLQLTKMKVTADRDCYLKARIQRGSKDATYLSVFKVN